VSGVDVSWLKAGQRVRVTYEGVVEEGRPSGWSAGVLLMRGQPDVVTVLRRATGDAVQCIIAVAVEVLPAPAWVSARGEAVRETRTGLVWVCDADKWSRAGSDHAVSDKVMAEQIAAGLVVHLVPEGTP